MGERHICRQENTLSAPHVFDVTKAMNPGTHTITVLIGNSKAQERGIQNVGREKPRAARNAAKPSAQHG
jgi:hypothetical protein